MDRAQSISLILSPALFLAGWIVMALTWPGTIAQWLISHTLLLAGTVLLLPGLLRLRSLATWTGSPRAGAIGLGVALVGLPFMAGQLVIDLAVAATSPDRASMAATFDRLTSEPLIGAAFYTVGPTLLWVGLGVLAGAIALSGTPRAWAGLVTALGVILLGASRFAGSLELAVAAYLAMTVGLGAIALGDRPAVAAKGAARPSGTSAR